MTSPRTRLKDVLARPASSRPADGLTVLIYHRVGGGTPFRAPPPTPTDRKFPVWDYSIRRPEMAREITSCWICSVPS